MSKATYECEECGATFVKWAGKCSRCHTFGSVTEKANTGSGKNLTGLKSKTTPKEGISPARQLHTVKHSSFTRIPTGLGELDRVLGGGLVPGQVVLMAGEPGVGKALALHTIVPTPTGWTTIGDISVGDKVLGRNGEPVEVVAVSEVFTDRDCYQVRTSSGDEFVADANHEWLCEYKPSRTFRGTNQINALPASPEITLSGIFTTSFMHENHRTVEGFPTLHLPPTRLSAMRGEPDINGRKLAQQLVESLQNENDPSWFDAGQGVQHFTCSRCAEEAQHLTKNNEGEFSKRSSPSQPERGKITANPSICSHHHGPPWHAILRASRLERLTFAQEVISLTSSQELQQPLDTEAGSPTSEDLIRLTFPHLGVSRIVEGVLRTLGYETFLDATTGSDLAPVYTVRAEKVTKPYIFFVQKVDTQPVKCIQVNNPNGLFLIGENYTVTHNSTILLTAANSYTQASDNPTEVNTQERSEDKRVLYISGEESVEQISLRAQRIGVASENIFLADETDVESVLTHINDVDPDLIVVDSVQTIGSPHVEGRVGGMAQVHEISNILTRTAKERQTPLVLVGQINKSNELAGPKTLEHLVDTVLMFEGDPSSGLRLLRSVKNRFGSAEEIACFEQSDDGIHEVLDPSGLFLTGDGPQGVGSVTTITMEGRRPLAVEIQALANYTNAPNPRRGVSGLDYNRVAMLIAITEKYGKVKLYDKDAFFATVGGVRVTEPAADFAICAALMSTMLDKALPEGTVFVGEVALSGHLRKVRNSQQRLNEAKRLGYSKAVIPKGEKVPEGIIGINVGHVGELRQMLS